MYHETTLSYAKGIIEDNIKPGMGLHHITGYQYNRWIGTGIGAGFDYYNKDHSFESANNVIPIYAEARGYFLKKKVSPFYSVGLGYGFLLKPEDIDFLKGGLFLNSSLGYPIGEHHRANFVVAFGHKLQKVLYSYNIP